MNKFFLFGFIIPLSLALNSCAKSPLDAKANEATSPDFIEPPRELSLYVPDSDQLKVVKNLKPTPLPLEPLEPKPEVKSFTPDQQSDDEPKEEIIIGETPEVPSVSEPAEVEPVAPIQKIPFPDSKDQRPLDARILEILRDLEKNDMRSVYRRIQSINDKNIIPQDRFLLQTLQAFTYFRLGEDETSLDLIGKLYDDLKVTMPLTIEKMVFVRGPLRTISYGRYRVFEKPRFGRRDLLYLYVQPENLTQELSGDLWQVSLEVDFVLKDSRDHVVSDMQQFDDLCNQANELKRDTNFSNRRDFYYRFGIPLPKALNPGHYSLELTLKDLNSPNRKEATASADFILE